MSPEKPWLNSSEDGKDDAKNPKRKKSVRFGVPIAEIDAAKPKKAEKPEPKSAGETFIDELKKAGSKESGEAAAEAAKESDRSEKQAEKPTAEQRGAAEEAEPAGGKNAAKPSASEETYESLPNQEIKPNEFSGGEVIIRLQGDEPVAERVIPLHGETAREAPEDSERPDHPKPAEAPQTVFTRAEAPEPRPEPLSAAGGGELPPPPPPPERGPASPEPPEPERPVPVIEPSVEILRPQAESAAAILPNVATTAAAERPATKAEVEDALHRSAKIHAQRGALSGLFIGTWFANRGLRRRQKQERAELGRQGKQLEQVASELHAVRRTQESQHVNTEQRLHGVEKRFENPARPEKIVGAQAEKPQSAEEPAEQLEIPKDHHLETSAWHTIEVDSKTGKPVENPTFSYGHEYYQERAHEAAPKDQRNAAAGEVALVAAAMGQASAAAQPPSESSGAHIPLATTQGVPKSTPSTPDPTAAKKSPAATSSTGPLWPWLVALIVIIICLVIAIH